jgi:fido (protein-threonine AMPylation protein)
MHPLHPQDCPAWEYATAANYQNLLRPPTVNTIARLRSGQIETAAAAMDTRSTHGYLFADLTPTDCPYYAGHYRGEDFRCLRYYTVGIPADHRVGVSPGHVEPRMTALGTAINSALAAIDTAAQVPSAVLPTAEKLKYAITFACRAFVEILTTHPYANGNGHAARFLVWAIVGRYGYWPNADLWPIDPRPPNPSYSQLIAEYRNGNRELLETYVLSCYRPPPAPVTLT